MTITGAGRKAHEVNLCSDLRAVRKVSAGDGMDWAVIVKFRDSRRIDKEVRVSCGDAATEPSKCIHELASAGLLIHVEDPQLYRLLLKAVVHASVPLAYRLVKAGWFPIGVRSHLRAAVRRYSSRQGRSHLGRRPQLLPHASARLDEPMEGNSSRIC